VANPTLPHRIRFADFEADLVAGELRKDGLPEKILLQHQPLAILRALVAQPGEMVSREELIQLLWNGNTNVDFDPSLNKAVNRLRESLGDSAEAPRYIETLSRRGYRFIGKIELLPTSTSGTNRSRAWRKIAACSVVGAACVLAAAFAYHRIRPPVDAAARMPVPFTAYPGIELWPTFSPDGSQIAFVWNGDPGSEAKGYDLYVKVIGNENLLRLTHYPSETLYPAWSPDGTQIAFNRISGADTGLYVVPALGGSERKLRSILRKPGSIRTHFGSTAPISWSPDGKSIAFVDILPPNDNLRINLLSVETLESKQISHPAECINAFYPAFSHSGEMLAYVCVLNPDDMEFGIYTVPSRGGPAALVTRFKTGMGRPLGIAWKADDKKLILSRPRFAYDMELDEVTLADGSLRTLYFGQDACEPAISAKGDKLAFVLASFNHVDIWRKDLSHLEAAPVKLITSTRSQQVPQYSPDGRHIAFTSNRAGPWEIWMSDADGTHLVQLSDASSSDAVYARWSPDSQKIAFDSRHSGHAEVYIVDISERKPRRVVTNLPYMSTPSWSHDGRWLYVQSTAAHTDVERIFRCPAAGGDAVALSAKPSYFPWESYDGKTLYFADPSEKSSIHMVPLQPAGSESPLRGMPVVLDASEWTVVPRGIYFAPADARKSLCFFDFATKQVRRVFEVDNSFQDSLSVSPDERWILYTQAEPDNADIMLVENFR
jgi:Tol biopolymer transport system component/DNA-binding winged helix-turn-helix (wHTH) protein